jgi:hypothetical protein
MAARARGCCGWLIVALVLALVATAAVVAIMKRKPGGGGGGSSRPPKPLPVPGPPGDIDSKYGDSLGVALQFFQVQKGEYSRPSGRAMLSRFRSFRLRKTLPIFCAEIAGFFAASCFAWLVRFSRTPSTQW